MQNNLQTWVNDNNPSKDLYFAERFWDQIYFVRDTLTSLLHRASGPNNALNVEVISTHISKSVTLPVYKICYNDDFTFYLRGNFYDWKMSVVSKQPIECEEFVHLFHTTPPPDPDYTGNPLDDVYFEGFPKDCVFGYYSENKKQFSAQLDTTYDVYITVFLIMKSLNLLPKAKWYARVENG